jgi:hypothetical protein
MEGCNHYGALSFILTTTYKKKKFYPELQAPLNITVLDKNSVMVTANLTKPGVLYCKAFAANVVPSTYSSVKSNGYVSYTTNYLEAENATVTIKNLSPDTTYDIYCGTQDYENRVMEAADVRDTKERVITLCCRTIGMTAAIDQQVLFIPGSVIPEVPMTFELDSQPTGTMYVQLSYIEVTCDSKREDTGKFKAEVQLSPSRFNFTTSTKYLDGSFLVRSYDQVCINIFVNAVSAFDSYISTGVNLTVTGYNVPPDPPIMSQVRLSDTGLRMNIKFDRETDKGMTKISDYAFSFDCTKLLVFTGVVNSTCKWPSTTQLQVTFHSSYTQSKADIGDSITLIGGLVTNPCADTMDCSRLTYIADSTLSLLQASKPQTPIVALSSSTLIGACDDIVLDPSGSLGDGNRAWNSITWSVSVDIPDNDTAEAIYAENLKALEIKSLLDSAYSSDDIGYTFTIDNSYLWPWAATYSISLSLTNFFGEKGISTVDITVDDTSAIPRVKLSGVNSNTKYRWQTLNFFADAMVPDCAGDASKKRLEYSWKLYDDITYDPTVVSTSRDPRYFSIAAYRLNALTTYTATVVVTIPDDSVTNPPSSSASLTFQLGSSPVIANIDGGSAQTITLSDAFTLDASESYDVDYPDTTGRLSYAWDCLENSPTYGSSCDLPFSVSMISSTVTVPANTLSADRSYNFSVLVTSVSGETDNSYTVVTVTSRSVPRVSVVSASPKYNPTEKIFLSGTIVADPSISSVRAVWASEGDVVDLDEVALTKTSLEYKPVTSSFVGTFQLSIAANSLAAGLYYTFELAAAYTSDSKSTSTAYVTILTNEPPTGGSLVITPSLGMALNETFTFTASKWSDDLEDLPLDYAFVYYTDYAGNPTMVRSKNAVSYAESVLAAGLENGAVQYEIKGEVLVYDIYGAYNSKTAYAIVNPVSEDLVADVMAYQLYYSARLQDPSKTAAAIMAVSTALNIVDCNAKSVCDGYNRNECSKIPLTCGECKSGYIGLAGHANTECVSLGGRRRLTSLGNAGDNCGDNTMCLSGNCVSNICEDINKICPNDCSSGLGVCKFIDSNTGTYLSNCYAQDPTCYAKCECEKNDDGSYKWYGEDCSYNEAEYLDARDLRETLCSALRDNMDIQDLTADVVSGRAVSVADLYKDMMLVSDIALEDCTYIITETISSSPELAQDFDIASEVTAVLSLVLNRAKYSELEVSDDLLGEIYATLAVLAQGCQGNLAIGEAPMEFVDSNLRMSVGMTDSVDMQNSSFTVPLSAYESYSGTSAPELSLTDVADSADAPGPVGLMFLQYLTNPQGVSSNSSNVLVEATRYDSSSARRVLRTLQENRRGLQATPIRSSLSVGSQSMRSSRFGRMRHNQAVLDDRRILVTDYLDILVQVQLHNVEEILYEAPPIIQSLVKCEVETQEAMEVAAGMYSPIPKMVNGTCENVGYKFNIMCPGVRGEFNNTCPSYEKVPQCVRWETDHYVADDECEVVSYDTFSTTCRCGVVPSPTSMPTDAPSTEAAGANVSSSAMTRKYRSLSIADMNQATGDLTSLTPKERIKRRLADSSFSFQLTSSFTIISSPFIQNFTAAPLLVLVEPDSTIFQFLTSIVAIFVVGLLVFSVWDFREIAWERANANKKPLRITKSELFETADEKKKRIEAEEDEKKRRDEEYDKKYGADGMKVQGGKGDNASTKSDDKELYAKSSAKSGSPRGNKVAIGDGGLDEQDARVNSPTKSKPGAAHFGEDVDDIVHTHHRSITGFFNTILPEEFDEGKWFDLWVHRIMLEHPWLCMFAPYKKGRDLRAVKFAISMCNLIAFLFTTTLLSVVFFQDNGYCENISAETECNAQFSWQGLRNICSFNTSNDYCMFVTPFTDFYTILIYTVTATSLALPLRKSMEYMILKITKRYPKKEDKKNNKKKKKEIKGVAPETTESPDGKHYHDADLDKTMEDVIHAEDWEHHMESAVKTDEFRDVQRLQGTLMRAARLDKAQKSMDFVLPVEETALVMLQSDADTQRFKNHMIFKNRVDNFSFRILRYGFSKPKTKDIQKKLVYAREYADYIKGELELMNSDEEREAYLMKAFFVDIFQGFHKAIAHRYMLGSFESVRYAYFRAMRKLLFTALLPALLLVMLYLIYVYHFTLGTRSTSLWLYIVIVAFIQEVLLLQPLKILMRWIVINNVVSEDIRKTVLDFRDRSRIILIRSSGLMRDSNALVQHFNPACRAARMFPELPISRLLMTVGDFDIPTVPQRGYLGHALAFAKATLMAGVLLPVSIQDPLFELVYNLIINGVMLGLYLYSQTNLIIMIVMLVVVSGALASREYVIRFFERRAAEERRRQENEYMFYDVEQENILDMQAFVDEKKKKARELRRMQRGTDDDEESKDGSVYLDELDMASPDQIRKKPSEDDFMSPGGYDADGSPDNVMGGRRGNKLDGIHEEDGDFSPDNEIGGHTAKPLWGSPTIHAIDGLGEDFVGSIAYETNRPIEPIKGPPIAASNFRIYGPTTGGAKQGIESDYEEKKKAGTLIVPPADGTRGKGSPSLMEILDKNPTLFNAAQESARSGVDDYESDHDSDRQGSVGPYTKRLGSEDVRKIKSKNRQDERKEMKGQTRRSRKRTQERHRRARDRGPGDRNGTNQEGSDEEPHLYMTEEEREAYKEEQRVLKEKKEAEARGEFEEEEVELDDDGNPIKRKKEREPFDPDGYGGGYGDRDPRDGSQRRQRRDQRRREREDRREEKRRSRSRKRSGDEESERDYDSHRDSRRDRRDSYDDDGDGGGGMRVREDRGSRRRRGNQRQIRASGTRQPGAGGRSSPGDNMLDRGDASVSLMQINSNQALPAVDFLAGLSEQEDTANFPMYS